MLSGIFLYSLRKIAIEPLLICIINEINSVGIPLISCYDRYFSALPEVRFFTMLFYLYL
jgi:hypothetical protein